MAETKIEWADKVWNPVVGCSKVSMGCNQCYAERWAARMVHNPKVQHLYKNVVEQGKWTGKLYLNKNALDKPLNWIKPSRIFVNSMSDLFHKNVPRRFVDDVFSVMQNCPQHRFLILTKRPENIQQKLYAFTEERPCRVLGGGDCLPNVGIYVSCENQEMLDKRVPLMLKTPFAWYGVSIEPMLGPIDMSSHLSQLNHVIAGGESGPGARPMHPDWVRSLRDQCVEADVPFFFKQWGEYKLMESIGRYTKGKKLNGRMLDGRYWDEMPEILRID